MTLNGHFAFCFKMHAFSEPSAKILTKVDPYRQRCSAMNVLSGNIRFMRIFVRVPRDEASNDSGAIENIAVVNEVCYTSSNLSNARLEI